jgi:hypothetical protein
MNITQSSAAPETNHPATASPRKARSRWTRRVAAAATVAIGIAASGVAFAAWNVTGTGDGAATAANAENLVIENFVLSAALYPGLTTGGTLTVSNPNLFPVNITDVAFGTLDITNAGDDCTIVLSQVTFTNVTGAELFLAADTENIDLTLTDIVTMGSGANDDCQGATFTAPITLTAESTTAP